MVRRRAWRARLIPAAAAASVVGVIAVVAGVTGGPRIAARSGADRGGSGGTEKTTGKVPRYFAYITPAGDGYRVVVLSSATGAVVASTPVLDPLSASPLSIAAAPGDRTFSVDYYVGTQPRSTRSVSRPGERRRRWP